MSADAQRRISKEASGNTSADRPPSGAKEASSSGNGSSADAQRRISKEASGNASADRPPGVAKEASSSGDSSSADAQRRISKEAAGLLGPPEALIYGGSEAVPPSRFEQAFTELQQVVEQLEDGGLALERALQLFERGTHLAQACERIIDQAELRVTRLTAESASPLSEAPPADS